MVECAFGLLAQRWRIYHRKMNLKPENADKIVKATVVLHNFLRGKKTVGEIEDALNPDNLPIPANGALAQIRRPGFHSKAAVYRLRDKYKDYFNSPEGAVPWQNQMVFGDQNN